MRVRQKTPMTFEHSMLRTATLCLIAFGAVMVYSASSGTTLLSHGSDSSYYLKRYLASAIIGMGLLTFFSRFGVGALKRLTPILLGAALFGLVAVLLPGIGLEVNGARRWIGAGALQVQPSELAKLALVLYSAGLIANRPERTRSLAGVRPLLVVGAVMAGLVVLEPDLGTAIVLALTLGALLVVGGVKMRHLLTLAGTLALLALLFTLLEPYRRARLTSFLNPWSDTHGAGFQSVQAMIAIGSGGPFGVGLGESVQKLFYLPEAHTDMILAVIGEELGFAGISAVLFLYGMIAYGGLRAARTAKDLYSKLVAAGITSVILTQATINFFAVLGVLPLTGVPLPFISYGNSNLVVLLGGMGILINIAQQGAPAVAPSEQEERGRRRRRHLRLVHDGAQKGMSLLGRAVAARAGAGRGRPAAKRTASRSTRRAAPRASVRKSTQRAEKPPASIRKLSDDEDRDRSRRDRRTRRPGVGDRRRAAG
jgi:cell division protein FtsW